MVKSKSSPHNAALVTGDVVKWARERLNKSQQEIASDLGVTDETIHSWETEKVLPDFKTAQKLAVALHIPFGYLFLTAH